MTRGTFASGFCGLLLRVRGLAPRGRGAFPPPPPPAPAPPSPGCALPRAAFAPVARQGAPRPRFRSVPPPPCGVSFPRPPWRGIAPRHCGLLLRRAGAAGWVPVRSLWCGVCFAGFFILAPPTHPADKSADIGAHFGRLVGCPFARYGVVSASQAFLYSLRPPTQPHNGGCFPRTPFAGATSPAPPLQGSHGSPFAWDTSPAPPLRGLLPPHPLCRGRTAPPLRGKIPPHPLCGGRIAPPLRGILPPHPLCGDYFPRTPFAGATSPAPPLRGLLPPHPLCGGSFPRTPFAGAPSPTPPFAAGCVPVRALVGWCLLRRLVYSALRPPTQPTNRRAFAGCFCAEWLRLALPQGAGQTWLAMFHSLPYYGLPLGGRVPQGGAHSLPPSSRPAQFFAGCFCASCSLLLRPVCASLAWLIVAARIRGHHAALWAARGLPRSPRPLRSRALGRFAPRRALSPPAPWARKRAPMLLRAALFAAVDGWALSRCRPPFGRPHARSCPLGFSAARSGKLSLRVSVLARFARAVRS